MSEKHRPVRAAVIGVSEGRMIRYPVRKYEPLKAELEVSERKTT